MSKTKTKAVTVLVKFGEAEVTTNINLDDYLFGDLDAWVRTRFGIRSDDKLRYFHGNSKTGRLIVLLHKRYIS